MKKNRFRNILLNLLALGAGCIAALLILEVGLRIYNPFESRVRGDKIILPVNKRYVFESDGLKGTDSIIVHTKNSMGFRGPELPPDGLEDHLSIIAVGGSTTECFYISDGSDWPSVVRDLLSEEFSPIWLNNAGLDGHSTFGHMVLLDDFLADLDPDIILYLVGANDVAREETSDFTASHLRGSLRFSSVAAFVKSISAYSEVASASLNLYRYIRAKKKGLAHHELDLKALVHADSKDPKLDELEKHHIDNFIPGYEKRLRTLVRMTKEAGIEPVLVTQPFLFGDVVDPVTGVNMGTAIIHRIYTGFEHWSILERYNEVVRIVARQEDVLIIDLARDLEKRSEFFYDSYHYTDAGCAEVGRIIYMQLRPWLKANYGSFSVGSTTE